MEQPIPKPSAWTGRRNRLIAWAAVLAVCLVWSACLILEVEMPETANVGEVITVKAVIQENEADQNPWKGVLSVMVPMDWEYVSGEYAATDDNGALGGGMMVESTDWADSTQKAIAAPDGMKWIGTISDTSYAHGPTLVAEVWLQLQVGQTTGEFELGYVATKESYNATCDWFMTCGEQSVNGADSSMGHMITVMGGVAIEDVTDEGIPSEFVLEQNYPNPFNPSTTIRYAVEDAMPVSLSVFDVAGREVAQLVNETKSPGVYEATFEADGLPSGTYLYRLQAGDFSETRTMVLTK